MQTSADGTLVTVLQPLDQEQQTDAESLASAIDATEQTRPPLGLGPATVTPPASEAQRLQAALQLRSFFTPAIPAPDGYSQGTVGSFHPAEEVELIGSQFAGDPAAELHRYDEQLKVVMTAGQVFTREQNDGALAAVATAYADPQAAAFAVADPTSAFFGIDVGSLATSAGANLTSAAVDPTVQLGDATRAYRASVTRADGSGGEIITLLWTHGSLGLGVVIFGPAGSTSMDQVVALAQQVEARFQASPLPTDGLSGS